jgi:hypothetical protein
MDPSNEAVPKTSLSLGLNWVSKMVSEWFGCDKNSNFFLAKLNIPTEPFLKLHNSDSFPYEGLLMGMIFIKPVAPIFTVDKGVLLETFQTLIAEILSLQVMNPPGILLIQQNLEY